MDVLNKAFPGVANYLIDSYGGGIIESDNNQHLIGEQLLAEQIKRLEAENTSNSILNKWSHLLYEGIDDKIYDFTLNPICEKVYVNDQNRLYENEQNRVYMNNQDRFYENNQPLCREERLIPRYENCPPVYSFSESKPIANSAISEASPYTSHRNYKTSRRTKKSVPIPIPVKHVSPSKSVYFGSDCPVYPVHRDFKDLETSRSTTFVDEYVNDRAELDRLENELDNLYVKYNDELAVDNETYTTNKNKLNIISEAEEFDESDESEDEDEYLREELRRPLTRLSNYGSSFDISSKQNQKFRSDFNFGKDSILNSNNINSTKRKLRSENSFIYPTNESIKKEEELQTHRRKLNRLAQEKNFLSKHKSKSSSSIINSTEIDFEQDKNTRLREKPAKKQKSSLKSNCKKCLSKICRLSSSKDTTKGEYIPLF